MTGQTSSAQSVITVSAEATGTSVTAFDRAPEVSSPASARTRAAIGCTRQGWDPALSTRTPGGANSRPSASANWLRAELATQRNTTRRPPSAPAPGAAGERGGGVEFTKSGAGAAKW